LRSY
jgi:hypothetical protein